MNINRKEDMYAFPQAVTERLLHQIGLIDLISGSLNDQIRLVNRYFGDLVNVCQNLMLNKGRLANNLTELTIRNIADTSFLHFFQKLQSWNYWRSSSGQLNKVEDVIDVLKLSANFARCLEKLQSVVKPSDESNMSLKEALNWNSDVCLTVLLVSCENLTTMMKGGIESIHSRANPDMQQLDPTLFPRRPANYIIVVVEEISKLFHSWEQLFLDNEMSKAFFLTLKERYEGDRLFKLTIAILFDKVMTEFISSIGRPATLHKNVLQQFIADTNHLIEAFNRLQVCNFDELKKLAEKMITALEG